MELITLPKTNDWIPKMIVCQKVTPFKNSFFCGIYLWVDFWVWYALLIGFLRGGVVIPLIFPTVPSGSPIFPRNP